MLLEKRARPPTIAQRLCDTEQHLTEVSGRVLTIFCARSSWPCL